MQDKDFTGCLKRDSQWIEYGLVWRGLASPGGSRPGGAGQGSARRGNARRGCLTSLDTVMQGIYGEGQG